MQNRPDAPAPTPAGAQAVVLGFLWEKDNTIYYSRVGYSHEIKLPGASTGGGKIGLVINKDLSLSGVAR